MRNHPCCKGHDSQTDVVVVPVTHSAPSNDVVALELPQALKQHLGLDAERSWVVYSESNVFTWPGPDIRRVDDRVTGSIAYGMLPPRFFAELKRRFLALELVTRERRVTRTE